MINAINELIDAELIQKEQQRKKNGDFDNNCYQIEAYENNNTINADYGFVAKDVLTNRTISIQAKAVYIVLAVYSRANYMTMLRADKLAHCLGTTRTTFNIYRNELVAHNIIAFEVAGSEGIKYTILVRPTRTVANTSEKRPTPNEPTLHEYTPNDSTPEGPTSKCAAKISNRKSNSVNNEQIIINSDEDDVPSEERIRNLLVDTGTLPTTLLTNKTERDIAVRLLVTETLVEQPPSRGTVLCCRALSSMLTPGRITKIEDDVITQVDVLRKVNSKIICDSGTLWIPQLTLDEVIDHLDDALEYDNIKVPVNYAKKCIYNFLWHR